MTITERIAWGTLFSLIALTFSTGLQIQFTLPKLFWLQAVAPVLLLLWLARFRRGEARCLPKSVLITAGTLIGWWVITTALAVDPATAIYGMHGRYNGLLAHLILVMLFLIVGSTASSQRDIEILVVLFIVPLVPVSIYAIAQYFGWDPHVWPNPRPASTIGQPVPLAAILSLAAPFALAFAVTSTHIGVRVAWAATLALLVATCVATLSRGPWVGLAVAFGVVLIAAHRHGVFHLRGRAIAVAAVWIAFGVWLLPNSIQLILVSTRVQNLVRLETDPSFMNRFVFFDAAARMLQDYPIVGVGLEGYGLLYPRYRPVEGERVPIDELPTKVHNGYLQAAVTTGMPGLILYLALVGVVMVPLIRNAWRLARPPDGGTLRHRMLSAAFVGAISGYLVQDLSGWQEISLSVFFWFVLAAGVAFSRSDTAGQSWRAGPGSLVAVSLSAIAAAGAMGVLSIGTLRLILADQRLFEARQLNMSTEWPRIEANLATVVQFARDEPYYEDAVGVLYVRRLFMTADPGAYQKAASLLDAAARFAFDPYVLIHRIDLETAALHRRVVATVAESVTQAVAKLVAMDPNNATVHESVARLALAGGHGEDARISAGRAIALRPNEPRYHVIKGDSARLLGNRAEQIDAYRHATALMAAEVESGSTRPGAATPADWLAAGHKHLVALLEDRQHQAAVAEGQGLVTKGRANSLTLTLLGAAHLGLEAPAEAAAAFQEALALDPTNVSAQRGLVEATAMAAAQRERGRPNSSPVGDRR